MKPGGVDRWESESRKEQAMHSRKGESREGRGRKGRIQVKVNTSRGE